MDGFAPGAPSEIKAESAVKATSTVMSAKTNHGDVRKGVSVMEEEGGGGYMNHDHVSDPELVADTMPHFDPPHRGKEESVVVSPSSTSFPDAPQAPLVVSQPNTSLSNPPHSEREALPVVSQPSTSLPSLQDRRQQQLKLINEKLAKRHSTLQRKELPSHSVKLSAQFESLVVAGVSREDSGDLRVAPSVAVKSSNVVRKTALMQPTLSREVPGKSVAYTPTLYTDAGTIRLDSDQSPISSEAFTVRDPLPTSLDPEEELLDSESSFLPVPALQNSSSPASQTVPTQHSHEGSKLDRSEEQNTDLYISSLLSSLSSAYGYTSLAEKSRLLSSLVGSEKLHSMGDAHLAYTPLPPPEPDFHREAVKIQTAYRSCLARRRYKRQLKEFKAAQLIQATW